MPSACPGKPCFRFRDTGMYTCIVEVTGEMEIVMSAMNEFVGRICSLQVRVRALIRKNKVQDTKSGP